MRMLSLLVRFSEDYGKRKEKPGAFPLNPRLISSQSYRGLQNCEYNSLATFVFWFFLLF